MTENVEVMHWGRFRPFKVYFNVDLVTGKPKESKHREGTVALNESAFATLNNAYKELRK